MTLFNERSERDQLLERLKTDKSLGREDVLVGLMMLYNETVYFFAERFKDIRPDIMIKKTPFNKPMTPAALQHNVRALMRTTLGGYIHKEVDLREGSNGAYFYHIPFDQVDFDEAVDILQDEYDQVVEEERQKRRERDRNRKKRRDKGAPNGGVGKQKTDPRENAPADTDEEKDWIRMCLSVGAELGWDITVEKNGAKIKITYHKS